MNPYVQHLTRETTHMDNIKQGKQLTWTTFNKGNNSHGQH